MRRPELCVALDLPTAADALRLADAVAEPAVWYKVGPVLFVSEGPPLVRALVERGLRVFLDLKWHDIPNTVEGAVAAAAGLGASLATLHLAGGRAMLEMAVRAREGSALRLVGVGVLTSFSAAGYATVVGREVADVAAEQERFARGAIGSGLDGFVCAVPEAPMLRKLAGPEALLVTPGIRRAADAAGDQQRTATPTEAARAGADLLVVGRPITAAVDPAAAVRGFLAEMVQ
jgi:orotidine-5'-phosphate decarboxylase